ncbi:penicillin-binding protein 1C [Roseateles toxinivorans]|uniref:peptidoglycan glycosyltransferase n=1 Tax=Roseateles toxinivorans TaxID=270368 RepID=A0A4R6QPF8_9BURK|nr:penicillin-binding protein 1C [Roseateles toxinivorans]
MFVVLAVLRLLPKPPLQAQASYSSAFYSGDGALLRLSLARDEQYRVWTPLEQIDPRLVEAVQLYEDRWFAWHPGVNPASLVRGAVSTWSGDKRRGGSTLSMQLVRRLYRIDSRSPVGKLRQIAAALWLESRYGKREILEAYLNLAPYGGNIEGAGAASLIYFGKRADQLLLPEALALAVIPQNPNRRGGEAWPVALGHARGRLWQAWLKRHPHDLAPSQQASLNLPLNLRSVKELPFAAPHAVQTLMRQSHFQTPAAQTTLSLHMPTQRTVERTITQFLDNRKGQGLNNAAALLVDTQTMQVRAWVGSANWFDDKIDGQVNATTAKRSPGSTLKPFIYALALDQGVLHPASILKDAPTAFGTYSPENFDGRFEGPITAANALVRSRNIPAVQVSAKLKQPNLYQFLKLAGVSQLASEQHYGLALTLGGGELSMEELLAMYAMLANGGELKPLQFTTDPTPSAEGQQLLSPEAAFITLDMLRNNPRPDTGRPAFPRVAWKTGTSWGFRDAWTAGVFGRYALVVWLGNFDATSNPALVGVQAAAPLFFQIVDSLRSQGLDAGEVATKAPANLSRVPVCAASGDLPNEHCKQLAETWFIPGKSPIKLSTLHRAVLVDASGRAVCRLGANIREEVFEYWSSDMLQLFAQAGMPRRVPPVPARCGVAVAAEAQGDGPRIVSPLQGASYVLRVKQATPLTLRANAARQGLVYWFADAAYLGQSATGKDLSWQPAAAGRYLLSAVDAQGVADTREVAVEFTN